MKKGKDVGVWVVDVKNGNGSVKFGDAGKHNIDFCQSLIKIL